MPPGRPAWVSCPRDGAFLGANYVLEAVEAPGAVALNVTSAELRLMFGPPIFEKALPNDPSAVAKFMTHAYEANEVHDGWSAHLVGEVWNGNPSIVTRIDVYAGYLDACDRLVSYGAGVVDKGELAPGERGKLDVDGHPALRRPTRFEVSAVARRLVQD
jgi:hypothetical protein